MEEIKDLSITTFKIVLDNKILQINYNSSYKEYKEKKISSVIQEVLNKIGPKPSQKTYKDYILVCSCGRTYNPEKLICQAKCSHYSETDYKQEKNKNEKFFLYEKEKEEKYDKYLSNYDIESILMKVTGAKNIKKLKDIVPNENNNSFQISENLKKKIKELYTKKERGIKIIENGYELKYNETLYNDLLQFGIPNDKIKAALRMSNNIKEEALLLATDASFSWQNHEYLFYDNNEVLSNNEFRQLCREEVKKEFPLLNDEDEIFARVNQVINAITKLNIVNNRELEESEISEEDIDSSFEEIANDSDSNLNSSSFNL